MNAFTDNKMSKSAWNFNVPQTITIFDGEEKL